MTNFNHRRIIKNELITLTTKNIETIPIALFMVILLIALYTCDVMAESPHFVVNPNIINKNLHIDRGIVTLDLDLIFTDSGYVDNPISAFLTTDGAKSNNSLCINNNKDYSVEQKAIFGHAKGQKVSIPTQNGQIISNKIRLSLTVSLDKTQCSNNEPPFIRSALIQNVELHIVQNDDQTELTFALGDMNLPIGYYDNTQ
jgi:hypothetical protein